MDLHFRVECVNLGKTIQKIMSGSQRYLNQSPLGQIIRYQVTSTRGLDVEEFLYLYGDTNVLSGQCKTQELWFI